MSAFVVFECVITLGFALVYFRTRNRLRALERERDFYKTLALEGVSDDDLAESDRRADLLATEVK